MAKFQDISHWEEKPWYNSGGTRNKKVISDFAGTNYYFKESYKKGTRYFQYEFFSEVIASYLGQMLGLDILNYEIAVYRDKIGCLSQAMNDPEEDLIEGDKYLKAYDPEFILENEKPGEKYTFQLIEEALNLLGLSYPNVNHIIDIIIFDAIIGNSDRHQENWGFISKNTFIIRTLDSMAEDSQKGRHIPGFIKTIFRRMGRSFLPEKKQSSFIDDANLAKLILGKVRFAPIYDSGCCLGRELAEEKIRSMLTDQVQLDNYISKGKSEIHWEGKKLKHFDLLRKLIERDPAVKKRIHELISQFNEQNFNDFIQQVNDGIPDSFEHHKLPEERKQFIIKLITSRFKIIEEIIHE